MERKMSEAIQKHETLKPIYFTEIYICWEEEDTGKRVWDIWDICRWKKECWGRWEVHKFFLEGGCGNEWDERFWDRKSNKEFYMCLFSHISRLWSKIGNICSIFMWMLALHFKAAFYMFMALKSVLCVIVEDKKWIQIFRPKNRISAVKVVIRRRQ